MTERIHNFSAGPSAIPVEVLEQIREELLNCSGSGMSVMEMSHRSKEFDAIMETAEGGVRKNLKVPDDYAVLFLQGGASFQFAMVPANLALEGRPVDLIHTGIWTGKAMEEIPKFAKLNVAASTEAETFRRLPRPEELRFSPDASYVHLCSNNTIAGTQWKSFPDTGKVPVVADMSSDILSRAVDVSRFGLIFAGAQKNLGPAGVTLVVIRKDLAERASEKLPTMMQYRTHIENGSRYNTPPTFGIYVVALTMKWIERQGGTEQLEKKNEAKAKILYDAIDSTGFYSCPVEKKDRSLMNVVFRIKNGDEALEKKFDKEATANGLANLKGHRLVGGLRASIYNAVTEESIRALVSFMKDFEQKNG